MATRRITNSYLIVFFCTAALLSGCVPSNDPGKIPTFSILSTFFPDTTHSVLWHRTDNITGSQQYFLRSFDHQGINNYSNIYQTAFYFISTDTTTKIVSENVYVIHDSIVIEYLKKSMADSTMNEVIRLHGLLEKGQRFEAAKNFITSNGASIAISAEVDEYFGATPVSGIQYSDVYHITYTVTSVTSSTQPVEAEFQKDATLGVYYAKTIGPVYKVAKNAAGDILWSEEVIETRLR